MSEIDNCVFLYPKYVDLYKEDSILIIENHLENFILSTFFGFQIHIKVKYFDQNDFMTSLLKRTRDMGMIYKLRMKYDYTYEKF